MHRPFKLAVVLVFVSSALTTVSFGQAPAPVAAARPATIWHALGIPQGYQRIKDGTANRTGNRPDRERKPPLKALADPMNKFSDVPAIKKAAEIKAQEDLAPQKIKALKYLAQVSCGCYGGVAEAFMAALEDCTEEVRYTAAVCIAEAAGNQCSKSDNCSKSCCTKELTDKMRERAYERDDSGCWVEPSAEVREALQQALCACCPHAGPVEPGLQESPIYPIPQPQEVVPKVGERQGPGIKQATSSHATATKLAATSPRAANNSQPVVKLTSSRRGWQGKTVTVPADDSDSVETADQSSPAEEDENGQPISSQVTQANAEENGVPAELSRLPAVADEVGQRVAKEFQVTGVVTDVNQGRGYYRIAFPENARPRIGTHVDAFHKFVLGTEHVGVLMIRDFEGPHAIAVPKLGTEAKIARGDRVECTVTLMVPANQ